MFDIQSKKKKKKKKKKKYPDRYFNEISSLFSHSM